MEIFLDPWGSVTGRVLQPDNETVTPNAQVILRKSGLAYGYATTGSDGVFRFDHMPEGEYWLKAYEPATGREGSGSITIQLDGNGNGTVFETDVRLEGRGTVMGTVYDGSGITPVGNALVTLKRANIADIQTNADSDGNFRFEYISEGSFTIHAAESIPDGLWGEADGEIEYDEQNVTVNVFLKGTGTISGTVYEADGTTPVENAAVKIEGSGRTININSNVTGYFETTGVPVGSFLITVSKSGSPDKGTTSGTIDYHAQEKTVDVVFEGLGTVNGIVKDGSDNPIEAVNVTLRTGNEVLTGATGSGGVFSFTDIILGPFTVEAEYGSGPSAIKASGSGTLENAGDVIELNMQLDAAGSVSGTVYKSDGSTPAAGAYVTLHGTPSQGDSFTLHTTADASGEFEFNIVRVGNFSLEILGKSTDGRKKYTGTLSQSGDAVDTGDIVLDDVNPTVTSVFPADGSLGIPLTTTITMNFSEKMDTGTFADNIELRANGVLVPGVFVPAADGESVVFTPSSALTSFALYTIRTNQYVTDEAGNPLDVLISSTFTTSDLVAPQVTGMDPAPDAANVLPTAAITVTFNEPVETAVFTLLKDGVTPVSGALLFAENKMSVSFTPDAALATDGSYTVTVQDFTDIAGNTQSQAYTATFYTTDTQAPVLESLVPENGNTSVIEGVTVRVVASTGDTDVTGVYFFVNGQHKGTETISGGSCTFEFNAPYISETGSTFLVEAYAMDEAGNQSSREYLQFALVNDTPPQVSVDIANLAGNEVYRGQPITANVVALDEVGLTAVTFSALGGTLNHTETRDVADPEYSGSFDFNVPPDILPGTIISVTAEVVDSSGQQTTSAPINLQVNGDGGAKQITLTTPTDGTLVFPGEQFPIKAVVLNQSIISRVEFYIGTDLIFTDDVFPYETTYTVPTEAETGSAITIKAVAVQDDDEETRTSDQAVVTVVTGTELPDGTVIDPGDDDSIYLNGTIIIYNTSVTINGEHSYTHVLVKGTGVLTHAATAFVDTEDRKMELNVAGKLVVGPDARIDVNEKGYLGGFVGDNDNACGITLGRTAGAGCSTTGGSYGGYGGAGLNYSTVNDVYGSIYQPSNPGSGGGGLNSGDGVGGCGGGVIRVDAAELINDGLITSDGGSVGTNGGGSGGSIWLTAAVLKGIGSITSDGGDGGSQGGGGGGGRIAVYYGDASKFDLSLVHAYGGKNNATGTYPERNGSPGTIYLEKNGEQGEVLVKNRVDDDVSNFTPINGGKQGTITAIEPYILTDADATFVPGSLVGLLLIPNIERTETYLIIANTETVIFTDPAYGDMKSNAAVGDTYGFKHRGNVVLDNCQSRIDGNVTLPELIVVDSVLTVNGTINAGVLHLESGSILTHSPATTAMTYSLHIEADDLVIDSTSSIDVDGRGYLGGHAGDNANTSGRTLNNELVDASNKYSGGSYGGYGGQGKVNSVTYPVNAINGSLYYPSNPGSGGGGMNPSYGKGGSGGGVIRITAGELLNDGLISANGGSGDGVTGGSGGSIWINVETLRGGGTISADGGNSENSNNGSGGGGRIAIYYTDASEFDLTNSITAYGGVFTGTGEEPERHGSAGTIYRQKQNEAAELIIDNRGEDSYKPLIFPEIAPTVIFSVNVSQEGTVLEGDGVNYMPGSLVGMKLIPDTENPDSAYTIIANDGTTVTVAEDLTGITAGKKYKGFMAVDGNMTIDNTTAEISGDLDLGEQGELTITGNSSLSIPEASITFVRHLFIKAAKVTIDSGSSIDVSDRGYLGAYQGDNTDPGCDGYGRTLGNVDGSEEYCGASYGGLGGQHSTQQVNGVYGSLYEPFDPGSGGGGFNKTSKGGNGGGVVRITANELVLNGSINADGGAGNAIAPSGSGGSIWIDVTAFNGSGQVHAHGGQNTNGSGGGGRIAVYYDSQSSSFDLSSIKAYGGNSTTTGIQYDGGAGTVYTKDKNTANTDGYGDLVVDNNNIDSRADSTPLPAVGQGTNTTLEANKMVNTGASFITGALKGIKLNPAPSVSDVFTIISNTDTEIFTDPTDGNMTDIGSQYGAYIGEHHLRNLTVTGLAKVTTTDKIQVSGTMVVDAGAALTAENIQ
jgi:hypothetical protein